MGSASAMVDDYQTFLAGQARVWSLEIPAPMMSHYHLLINTKPALPKGPVPGNSVASSATR